MTTNHRSQKRGRDLTTSTAASTPGIPPIVNPIAAAVNPTQIGRDEEHRSQQKGNTHSELYRTARPPGHPPCPEPRAQYGGSEHRGERPEIDGDRGREDNSRNEHRKRVSHVEGTGNFLIRHASGELENRRSGREVADPQCIEKIGAESYGEIGRCHATRPCGTVAFHDPPNTGKTYRDQGEDQQQSARFGTQKLTLPSGSIDTSMPSGISPCCEARSRKIPGAGQSISRATRAPSARMASGSDKTIAFGAFSL